MLLYAPVFPALFRLTSRIEFSFGIQGFPGGH
jgi:hypothetical protein